MLFKVGNLIYKPDATFIQYDATDIAIVDQTGTR